MRRPLARSRSRRGALAPAHLVASLRVAAITASLALPLAAQDYPSAGASRDAATLPTCAVLEFTNGALVKGTDYGPLGKGMAEMLVSEMARNPGVRMVERDRLQQVLAEQDLAKGGRVDAATAAKVGKVLGARWFLTGSFVIDPKENVRLDVRAVNTETSAIEYVETVRGKAGDMLTLVEQLGAKVNAGLKLPPLPARGDRGDRGERADGGVASAGGARPARSGDQFRAMMLLSRALEAEDRKDRDGAMTLYRSALNTDPSLERARVRLALLERSGRGTR
ncbi:MAG: CsgG/HfaB family protein [Gemmatimonadaceae bacterium]|nr:CsgG/HfaB family protein [Gemmatimonadaceae bacterium]